MTGWRSTTQAATSSPSTPCGIPATGGFGDGRVLEQRSLDLARHHVVTAADDGLCQASLNPQEAVPVDPSEVAAQQPAVTPPVGRSVGVAPVGA